MSWKECDRVSLRREFVSLASVEGAKMSVLCDRFGISRKTGYKWLRRFRQQGEAGLTDRTRGSHCQHFRAQSRRNQRHFTPVQHAKTENRIGLREAVLP